MNLDSCENCGIVVDLNNVNYIDSDEDDGGYIEEEMVWGGDGYLETWKCPICETPNGVEK